MKRLTREEARQNAHPPLNSGSNVKAASYIVHEKHLTMLIHFLFPSFHRCALSLSNFGYATFEELVRRFSRRPRHYYRNTVAFSPMQQANT